LVETQSSAPGEDVTSKVTMSGASSLYAGFDNAVVDYKGTTLDTTNSITIKLNNDGGDKFWWEENP